MFADEARNTPESDAAQFAPGVDDQGVARGASGDRSGREVGSEAAAEPDATWVGGDDAHFESLADSVPFGEEPDDASIAAMAADADPRSRDELYGALIMAEAQRDEYLDDLRRSRAEFDNFRRRTTKDLATQRDSGKAELAAGLLETLDDLDRTVQAAEASSDEHVAQGVQMVAAKLRGALERAGLERVDDSGVAFDPERHEAVAQVPATSERGEDGPVVAEVMRPGYRWGERVLRAAMVTVEE